MPAEQQNSRAVHPHALHDGPPADPAELAAACDAAWRSLVIAYPGHGDIEIGPVANASQHAMAAVIGEIINANPPLRGYICDRLSMLPDVAGCRVIPVAALAEEIQMAVDNGVNPWGDDPS